MRLFGAIKSTSTGDVDHMDKAKETEMGPETKEDESKEPETGAMPTEMEQQDESEQDSHVQQEGATTAQAEDTTAEHVGAESDRTKDA